MAAMAALPLALLALLLLVPAGRGLHDKHLLVDSFSGYQVQASLLHNIYP